MPFDELKIDRSFTNLAYRDDRLKAIFEASLDLEK
jgi:EAL domain-containing protein (putative c-di-GMP-specific phosphodiesterase class I)